MPIEKFAYIVPMPGQGKRVMKSKLLTALGATGPNRPYTANPEHILERKILLQTPFNYNPSSGGGPTPPAPPALVTSGLFAYFESSDFDAIVDGTAITGWSDKLGVASHKWDTGFGGDNPTVDQVRKAGTHATARFNGKSNLGNQGNAGNGLYTSGGAVDYTDGVEYFVVFRQDNDPPTGAALGFNSFVTPCTDNGMVLTLIEASTTAFPDHAPFSDGNFYMGFGRQVRSNSGNPATSTAGANFHALNVSSKADGSAYNAWLDSENFFSTGAYTFSTLQGTNGAFFCCQLGGFSKGSGVAANFWGLVGNIAAVYCYNRTLTAAERTQMRAYFNANFGTSI